MIKISIIGLGFMGQNHLRVLSEIQDFKIDYLFDKNIKKAKDLSKKYNTKYTNNLSKVKNSSDAIIISTPTKDHIKYLNFFFKSNLKIFVEKPIVSNFKELIKIKKNLKNTTLQCGFIERYNSVTPVLKKFFRKNKVISVDFKRTDKLSDRIKDVDVIHDLMIHDIDLAVYFNGKIKKIFAHGFKKNKQICYATATLIHHNNVISKIEASRITQKKIRHINITTLKEYISSNLISKEIKINKQTNLNFSMKRSQPITITSNEQKVLVDQNEALKKEILEFLKLCKNKNVKVPNFNESVYILNICKKIEDAIEKNL
jgi:predicted dehydrogenase